MKNKTSRVLPDNWWDKGINPVLGYKYKQPSIGGRPQRNKFEYPPEDDKKIN